MRVCLGFRSGEQELNNCLLHTLVYMFVASNDELMTAGTEGGGGGVEGERRGG